MSIHPTCTMDSVLLLNFTCLYGLTFQSHYDINPEHKVVEIAVYKRSMKKLEKRFCSEHKEQELTFSCPGCYQTFCIMCLPENTQCTKGMVEVFACKSMC